MCKENGQKVEPTGKYEEKCEVSCMADGDMACSFAHVDEVEDRKKGKG